MLVDVLEDGHWHFIFLEQPAKLEQRRLVGRRAAGNVHADKPTDHMAVIERIINRLIGRPYTLLRDVHTRHLI